MMWWNKVMYPVRRVWNGVAIRMGFNKRGLLRLRHDVRACEYEDVRIMWEMLRRTETENGKSKKRSLWNCFSWARCSPYFGRNH